MTMTPEIKKLLVALEKEAKSTTPMARKIRRALRKAGYSLAKESAKTEPKKAVAKKAIKPTKVSKKVVKEEEDEDEA